MGETDHVGPGLRDVRRGLDRRSILDALPNCSCLSPSGVDSLQPPPLRHPAGTRDCCRVNASSDLDVDADAVPLLVLCRQIAIHKPQNTVTVSPICSRASEDVKKLWIHLVNLRFTIICQECPQLIFQVNALRLIIFRLVQKPRWRARRWRMTRRMRAQGHW